MRLLARFRRHWPVVAALGGTALVVAAFAAAVDLTPHVDESFFFSSHDPQLNADNEIQRLFPEKPQILIAAHGDLESRAYQERLRQLADAIAALPGVESVQSLARGPKDFEDAEESPLWSRLLVAPDRRSSNIFVTLRRARDDAVVERLDALRDDSDRVGFHLAISGVPYVNAHIERGLSSDLRIFSLAAIALFGVVLAVIFRSPWIVIGTFAACADSSAGTLLLTHLLHIPIGPLTANLSTMVFVMTLSPIVFLTFNWRRMALTSPGETGSPFETRRAGATWSRERDGRALMRAAVRETIVPSFWSSVCMTLGFISLLLVPSTPMRHLGIAGGIGAALAFGCAYGVYPWFLEHAGPTRAAVAGANASTIAGAEARLTGFFSRRHGGIVIALVVLTGVLTYGLRFLDTDPSLLSYFKDGSTIRNGLDLIDRTGGSSPLKIVVEDGHGARLDTRDADARLAALAGAMERDPAVGTVIALPLVIGEIRRHWYSFLFSDKHWLDILDEEKHGAVARRFIDTDRTRALFLLRMRESDRAVPREAVIARLENMVTERGFQPALVGGTYSLLDQQARLVTSSIVSGVLMLIGIFAAMGLAFSRSVKVAVAMFLCLAVIPVVVRGAIAYLGMPLDFVTASAANLDLGMGVDAMIYLTLAARHERATGDADSWTAWSRACAELWRPIGTSLLIIVSGFGIFLLSQFPPTQRFGAFVMFGSATAAAIALFMFPWLASVRRPLRRPRMVP